MPSSSPAISQAPWELTAEDIKIIEENQHNFARSGVAVKQTDASVIRRRVKPAKLSRKEVIRRAKANTKRLLGREVI